MNPENSHPEERSLVIVETGPGELMRRTTDAAGVSREIVMATAMEIQGRKYVKVEGWQAIAVAHGCVLSAVDVEVVVGGVRAIGEVRRMSDGALLARAEGFVGEDEPTWYGGETEYWDKRQQRKVTKMMPKRPEYAIRAMCQTRAMSRAARSAFAHVVVLIDTGLSTTPAEEVPLGGFDSEEVTQSAGREASTTPAAERPAQSKPLPKSAPAASSGLAGTSKERALSTRIHFGKNANLMLSELSPQQRSWYADKWLTEKERGSSPMSTEDKVLMEALKVLYPLPKDKPQAAAPEHENQETAPLLTNLGKLLTEQQGFSSDDLRDWLRTLKRGSSHILAADKEIEHLPASELESILKNWKKVAPDVTAFRKKREQQELIDTAPLN